MLTIVCLELKKQPPKREEARAKAMVRMTASRSVILTINRKNLSEAEKRKGIFQEAQNHIRPKAVMK
jgi:hypothetical protein